MRFKLATLCALLGLAGVAYAQEPANLAFEVNGPNGKVSLTAKPGKIVYVDFWASWCAPCKQSFPFMNELQKKYGASGLRIIAVNVDKNNDDAKTFLAKNPAQFTVAFDTDGVLPSQYLVKGMPTSYLLSREGKLLYQHKGFKLQDQNEIEAQIKAALEGGK
jgi:thiol-disulfide isomerase/thioredoxin